jgi:trk system potassium uptake protein TrkA
VERNGRVTSPGGDFALQVGDDVFITAGGADLAALVKNLGLAARKVTQVTLVGGSRLAAYLAALLLRSGTGVKIIEKDPERCVELSEMLPDADVVEGDGTEPSLLRAEGVARSDALVTLTDIDEENIVLSMFARQMGMAVTVTKCNRTQYSEMLRKMDVDMVVSPKETIADEIVRYVRAMDKSTGGAMLTLHQIANGKAEAMEFGADGSCHVLDIPLAKLPLKKGILIACISRGNKTIIPGGADMIKNGDSVVVLAAAGSRLADLDDILQ